MADLKLLIIEDNSSDAELMIHELTKDGFHPSWRRVETEKEYKAQLSEDISVILADCSLPQYNALRALRHLQERELDIPFIVVTGAVGDEVAVEYIKKGAADYLLKDRLTRLGQAVRQALEQKKLRDEKRRTDEELRKTSKQLRALSAHLQSIREEESTRIAQRIHDELGQALTALKMDAVWLHKRFSKTPKECREKLRAMITLLDDAVTVVQRISMELRPSILDDLGLPAAIEWQAEEIRKTAGMTCKLLIRPSHIELDRDLSTAIYRIFRESMTNIIRHAKATHFNASLIRASDLIELTIVDNGRGIREEDIRSPKSFGLIQIRERAMFWGGVVHITGSPGQGTTVQVKIPLPGSANSAR
jgi:signal transduction histidine kinase